MQGQLRIGESLAICPFGDVCIAQRIENPATGEFASVTKDKNRRLVIIAGDQVEIFVQGVDLTRVEVSE